MLPDFPRGFFETLFVLAAIGIVSACAGGVYLLWWLVQHVRFV